MNKQEPQVVEKPITFTQVIFSIFASAFGVQTSENRARDFTKGKLIHFVVSGILFTIVFVVLMLVLVNSVMSNVS